MYQIYDLIGKQFIGKPSSNKKQLRRKTDKLDLKYGAIRYIVVKRE